jgi:hypothetical protein
METDQHGRSRWPVLPRSSIRTTIGIADRTAAVPTAAIASSIAATAIAAVTTDPDPDSDRRPAHWRSVIVAHRWVIYHNVVAGIAPAR